MGKKVIGIDFGSDSARAVLVEAADGKVLATASMAYPRWSQGLYCDLSASSFRQHPADYEEVLHYVLNTVLQGCDCKDEVVAIGVDTTASTPALADASGMPLALNEEFSEDPDAMFVLWKDHTAIKEAEEITEAAAEGGYCSGSAGKYSAENLWSKILHILRTNPKVAGRAATVVEQCDYIPSLLIGARGPLSHCAAAFKAMWDESWGGLPPQDFFEGLNGENLVQLRNSFPEKTVSASSVAGFLSREWAEELGLREDVVVSAGNVDAHSGAVGAGCCVGTVALNMGTSACLMAVMPSEEYSGKKIDGVFGQVKDGIIEGLEAFEMGMSSFGDNFAWFKSLLCETMSVLLTGKVGDDVLKQVESQVLPYLGERASGLEIDENSPFATDWFNGRRSPAPDPTKKASLEGLHITTDAVQIYRALIEANAFGVKAMVDNLVDGGVRVDRINAIGGIARKSPFMVQMIADATGCEIFVPELDEACGLGAAVNATVAAGLYDDVPSAQNAMCAKSGRIYVPHENNILMTRYKRYRELM